MPRHGGSTRRTQRNKHQGHKMHRRGRVARLLAKAGRGRKATAWGRGGL